MNYLKLLKLMYIADRESLKENHTTISGDSYVSMNHGPVLSLTYNLIKGEVQSDSWQSSLQKVGFDLKLIGPAPEPGFSEADEEILVRVFKQYEHMDKWTVRDLTHDFPEWEHPHGSSKAIPLPRLLNCLEIYGEEAEVIACQSEMSNYLVRQFASA